MIEAVAMGTADIIRSRIRRPSGRQGDITKARNRTLPKTTQELTPFHDQSRADEVWQCGNLAVKPGTAMEKHVRS